MGGLGFPLVSGFEPEPLANRQVLKPIELRVATAVRQTTHYSIG